MIGGIYVIATRGVGVVHMTWNYCVIRRLSASARPRNPSDSVGSTPHKVCALGAVRGVWVSA